MQADWTHVWQKQDGFLSCILPVPRAGRRLHLGVWDVIVPCVRFITQHSGFFLSDGITCSLSSNHIHSLNAGGLPYSATDSGAEGQPPQTNVWSRWCDDTSVIEILWNWWCHYIVVFYKQLLKDDLADGSEYQQKTVLTSKTLFCFLTICRRKFVEYFLICCFMSLQNLCSALHHHQLILSISTVQHKCHSWTSTHTDWVFIVESFYSPASFFMFLSC